ARNSSDPTAPRASSSTLATLDLTHCGALFLSLAFTASAISRCAHDDAFLLVSRSPAALHVTRSFYIHCWRVAILWASCGSRRAYALHITGNSGDSAGFYFPAFAILRRCR